MRRQERVAVQPHGIALEQVANDVGPGDRRRFVMTGRPPIVRMEGDYLLLCQDGLQRYVDCGALGATCRTTGEPPNVSPGCAD